MPLENEKNVPFFLLGDAVLFSKMWPDYYLRIALNPLQPGVAFLYLLKILENLSFLMFSGGIEKQHLAIMS